MATVWMDEGQKRADACDVIVVGAGLVGAAIASRLVREGLNTAVLEAQTVAGGATGRCAGMVLTGLAGHYKWATEAYGRQKAQEVWALTIEGRKWLVEAAERLEIPVAHTGSLALAVDDIEAEELEESATLLREDGFDVQFIRNDPLERGFQAALYYPDDVTVDAAALTQALLTDDDVPVHERTEVYDLETEQDGVRVWAQGRTVLCRTVVLAVNGYAPLFAPYFNDKIAPVRNLVLASQPLDQVILEQPCSANYGYEYCRQLPDRRLLLTSWQRPPSPHQRKDQGTGQEQQAEIDQQVNSADTAQDGLLYFASRHFPDVEIHSADRWSGVMGFSPDGLPMIGQLPGLPQAHFAVGFGGRGLAWSFVVAEQLAESLLHDIDPGVGIRALTRET